MASHKRKRVDSHDILTQLLLGAMTCAQLAKALSATPSDVQRVLDRLLSGKRIYVDVGVEVDLAYRPTHVTRKRETLDDTSIAGAPCAPSLRTRLSDYDESMRQRVALCLLARPR